MRVARFEVNKKPPEIIGEELYAPVSVQPTWFGEPVSRPKLYFFRQDEENGLGLPEYTEDLITDLWDNHVSGEVFEVQGERAYSDLIMYVFAMHNEVPEKHAVKSDLATIIRNKTHRDSED